jgi:hypothetical protein
MRILAPSGDDATVTLPVEIWVTRDSVGTGVIAVVTDIISVVVPGGGVVFVDSTSVELVTGIVVVVSAGTCVVTRGSRTVFVVVGVTVEFVIFWPLTQTGNTMNATITRIASCVQVFFMILSPLSLFDS